MTGSYSGVVVFVNGVHVPVDADGEPILDKPLRVNGDGSYRYASDSEPLHNDVHHATELELDPGGES